MKTDIELTGNDVWVATQEMTALGELAGMEIARHIWDSRHSSKITGFEYARKRGTRNMMNPVRPALEAPRGRTRVSARWTRDALEVAVDCEGRSEGDDRVIAALLPHGKTPWRFDCSPDGTLRLSCEGGDGPGEPASCEVTERDDGWSVVLTVPWSMLGVHPRPGLDLPFNVVRTVDWTDVDPPDMLPDGYLVNGLSRVTPGLEVSTLSRAIRYPLVNDPLEADRLGSLVLSPPLVIEEVGLSDRGLTRKELRLSLRPVGGIPEQIDALVTMVDPSGRRVPFVKRIPSEGGSAVELPYLFGSYRGFLYPYRIEVRLSDPDAGTPLAARTCRFLPGGRVRLDPLELGHEQRGAGRFRLAGPNLAGSEWGVALVNDAGTALDRGRVVAGSDEALFEVEIGEVPRGRYRLRLTPPGVDPACCVECPCNVMGRRRHPSVLLTTRDVTRLREDVGRGGLKPHYERMKQDVDEALERGSIFERRWTPTGDEKREFGIEEILSGDELLLQGFGEDTIFQRDPHLLMASALVYLIEGDERYGQMAKDMVRVLVDHVLWGDPRVYGADPDLMWKAMFCALVLDWLGEVLDPDERRSLRDRIVENGLIVYQWAMENDAAPWKGSIANLTPISDGGAAALALVLRDEALDAEAVLAMAREDVQTPIRAFPPEGSWPESVNYWGVFLHGVVFYGAIMESGMGTDDGVFSLPGMRQTGYFPIYFTPRGVRAGFNDGMNAAACPFLHLLARKYNEPLFSLYADAYMGGVSDGDSRRSDWYTVMWRSPDIEYLESVDQTEVGDLPAPPALASRLKLKTLQVYEEIRWAALASGWPHPKLYVSFKSGYAVQGFGHTSPDLNAIQVVAGGEPLIRRSHSYRTPPEGYSTVLIDGQPQQPATGTFIYWQETDRYRAIAAEADRSFGPEVNRVRRHVVMVDGRYLVIVDEVEASRPVRLTFMAHTAGQLDLFQGHCEITGTRTALSLSFVSPAVEQTCIDPPLCVMEQLTQRALHATTDPDRRIELVTVLWPAQGKAEIPNCEWDGSRLIVARPDGDRDYLMFGHTTEGWQFSELRQKTPPLPPAGAGG